MLSNSHSPPAGFAESRDVVKRWRQALADAGFSSSHPVSFHSSRLLSPSGDRVSAEAAYRDLLSVLPEHTDGLEGLAYLLQLQGRTAEVTACRQRLLRLRVQNLGVEASQQAEATSYLLAAEGRAVQPACAPPAYVRALFDSYAASFDAHLLRNLRYRAPQLLYDCLTGIVDLPPAGCDILDIGCGTGLAGEMFLGLANRLDGVDLSPAMLLKAEARGIYNRLAQGEILQQLPQLGRSYDLVVAADVLIYFGELTPVFKVVKSVLKGRGLFVFSLEQGESDGYRLRSTGRYQHYPDYVQRLAGRFGFTTLSRQRVVLREQDGRPVVGCIFVLKH